MGDRADVPDELVDRGAEHLGIGPKASAVLRVVGQPDEGARQHGARGVQAAEGEEQEHALLLLERERAAVDGAGEQQGDEVVARRLLGPGHQGGGQVAEELHGHLHPLLVVSLPTDRTWVQWASFGRSASS